MSEKRDVTALPLALDYVPQLMAAIERHEECEDWGTWITVIVAAEAVRGDEEAQRILRVEPGWQLTPEGSFV